MKIRSFALISISATCLSGFAPALIAQNTVQLFSAVDVRASKTSANYTTPVTFNTTTLNLNCTASPISATLSGPLMNSAGTAPVMNSSNALQPGGLLLADNNILVTVTPNNQAPLSTVNACVGGFPGGPTTPALYVQNCFKAGAYQGSANKGLLTGQDPDTYIPAGSSQTIDALGGVAPIQIGSDLVAGAQSVTIAVEDEGGWSTNSTLFLTTNCKPGGVTGPALVTGNPIGSTPTPQQLDQTFTFNPVTTQVVGFVYNLTGAQGTLTSNSGSSTPQVSDLPLNPGTFQTNLVPNTPFATAQCLVHSGELGGPLGESATQQACKLYTLECTNGTNPAASGSLCPISSAPNEVVQDLFDGPGFTLQDIPTPAGPTFHEGIGFLMASEGWGAEAGIPPGTWNWDGGTGGPCTFDPAADINLPCPQNLLTSFTGPGTFRGTGETTHPNSAFISIAGVPEPLTQVQIVGALPGNWVNTNTVNVWFSSQPPNLQGTSLPGAENFVPAPIQSITYGISPLSSVPLPANEPIANDITLENAACPIPTAQNSGPVVQPSFAPPVQTLTFPGDGKYLLHYYAQDCSGTQELNFKQVGGSWTTNFYTQEIDVDLEPPVITPATLVLTGAQKADGAYTVGEKVTVTFDCADSVSKIVTCGNSYYANPTWNTGQLVAIVNTSSPGSKYYTVYAGDVAGNWSEKSVYYHVEP
jgi:hypothetical protein